MSVKALFCSPGGYESNAEKKLYARVDLAYNVSEDILVAMEDQEVSKKELARRLGKSASYVTQLLSGSRNMTLGSLSDISLSLGLKVRVLFEHPDISFRNDAGWQDVSQTEKYIFGNVVQIKKLSANHMLSEKSAQATREWQAVGNGN